MKDIDLSNYGAFLLRISLGVMALAHGLLKVFVFTIPGTVAFFGSLGYPSILAYLVIILEVVGGLALILGIGTRIVSLALVPVLIGAVLVHAGNGWLFSGENGGWEFPVFWAVALLVQASLGSGAFSMEPLIFKRRKQLLSA